MNLIGNIIWFILGGFILALVYLFGSLVLMITIIGIPFGLQTLKLAGFALAPFGKSVKVEAGGDGLMSLILNIIWILFAGIELAVVHLMLAFLFGITILGIPLASQHLKMAKLALIPFSRHISAEL